MVHEDALLFRPTKCAAVRLKPVGFSNFSPCINSIVVPSQQDLPKILPALVQLKVHLTKAKRSSLLKWNFEVVPGRLSLRGAPAWRKGMQVRRALPSLEVQNQKPGDCEYEVPCTDGFCLSCPSCGLQKHVARQTLFGHGKWARLKCATCYTTCTARSWRCVCDAAWFSCPFHARIGFACKARVRKLVVRTDRTTSATINTNDIPPPSVDDGATIFPGAKRPATALQRKTVEASSSSEGMQAIPNAVAAPRGSKRLCNAQALKKEAKARAKSAGISSDTRAAIERMRDAKANPY